MWLSLSSRSAEPLLNRLDRSGSGFELGNDRVVEGSEVTGIFL
jgi:hypothetical protein